MLDCQEKRGRIDASAQSPHCLRAHVMIQFQSESANAPPRAILRFVELSASELKALAQAFAAGAVESEPMLNLRMEQLAASRAAQEKLPGSAFEMVNARLLPATQPNSSFSHKGGQSAWLGLATDGASFAFVCQDQPSAKGRATMPTSLEAVTFADLPFLSVAKAPGREATQRLRAAHLNWLASEQAFLSPQDQLRSQGLARAMATGNGDEESEAMRLWLDQGVPAETLMGLPAPRLAAKAAARKAKAARPA